MQVTKLAISLAEGVLPGLVSNMTVNVTSKTIDKLGRKLTEQGAVRGFTFFNGWYY